MMWIFDLALLLGVSICLFLKNPFLAILTITLGLWIHFQAFRVRALIGFESKKVSQSRKIKAGIIAVLISAAAIPFVTGVSGVSQLPVAEIVSESLLPITVIIGFLAAMMMIGLTVEKRKR